MSSVKFSVLIGIRGRFKCPSINGIFWSNTAFSAGLRLRLMKRPSSTQRCCDCGVNP